MAKQPQETPQARLVKINIELLAYKARKENGEKFTKSELTKIQHLLSTRKLLEKQIGQSTARAQVRKTATDLKMGRSVPGKSEIKSKSALISASYRETSPLVRAPIKRSAAAIEAELYVLDEKLLPLQHQLENIQNNRSNLFAKVSNNFVSPASKTDQIPLSERMSGIRSDVKSLESLKRMDNNIKALESKIAGIEARKEDISPDSMINQLAAMPAPPTFAAASLSTEKIDLGIDIDAMGDDDEFNEDMASLSLRTPVYEQKASAILDELDIMTDPSSTAVSQQTILTNSYPNNEVLMSGENKEVKAEIKEEKGSELNGALASEKSSEDLQSDAVVTPGGENSLEVAQKGLKPVELENVKKLPEHEQLKDDPSNAKHLEVFYSKLAEVRRMMKWTETQIYQEALGKLEELPKIKDEKDFQNKQREIYNLALLRNNSNQQILSAEKQAEIEKKAKAQPAPQPKSQPAVQVQAPKAVEQKPQHDPRAKQQIPPQPASSQVSDLKISKADQLYRDLQGLCSGLQDASSGEDLYRRAERIREQAQSFDSQTGESILSREQQYRISYDVYQARFQVAKNKNFAPEGNLLYDFRQSIEWTNAYYQDVIAPRAPLSIAQAQQPQPQQQQPLQPQVALAGQLQQPASSQVSDGHQLYRELEQRLEELKDAKFPREKDLHDAINNITTRARSNNTRNQPILDKQQQYEIISEAYHTRRYIANDQKLGKETDRQNDYTNNMKALNDEYQYVQQPQSQQAQPQPESIDVRSQRPSVDQPVVAVAASSEQMLAVSAIPARFRQLNGATVSERHLHDLGIEYQNRIAGMMPGDVDKIASLTIKVKELLQSSLGKEQSDLDKVLGEIETREAELRRDLGPARVVDQKPKPAQDHPSSSNHVESKVKEQPQHQQESIPQHEIGQHPQPLEPQVASSSAFKTRAELHADNLIGELSQGLEVAANGDALKRLFTEIQAGVHAKIGTGSELLDRQQQYDVLSEFLHRERALVEQSPNKFGANPNNIEATFQERMSWLNNQYPGISPSWQQASQQVSDDQRTAAHVQQPQQDLQQPKMIEIPLEEDSQQPQLQQEDLKAKQEADKWSREYSNYCADSGTGGQYFVALSTNFPHDAAKKIVGYDIYDKIDQLKKSLVNSKESYNEKTKEFSNELGRLEVAKRTYYAELQREQQERKQPANQYRPSQSQVGGDRPDGNHPRPRQPQAPRPSQQPGSGSGLAGGAQGAGVPAPARSSASAASANPSSEPTLRVLAVREQIRTLEGRSTVSGYDVGEAIRHYAGQIAKIGGNPSSRTPQQSEAVQKQISDINSTLKNCIGESKQFWTQTLTNIELSEGDFRKALAPPARVSGNGNQSSSSQQQRQGSGSAPQPRAGSTTSVLNKLARNSGSDFALDAYASAAKTHEQDIANIKRALKNSLKTARTDKVRLDEPANKGLLADDVKLIRMSDAKENERKSLRELDRITRDKKISWIPTGEDLAVKPK